MTASTSAPPIAPTSPRRGWRRALRAMAITLAASMTLVVLLVAGVVWWSGSNQSLATVLTQAARYLPAGQSLSSREVSGSLRAGGRIGWLRWQSQTLAVEVRDLRLGWQWRPLLQRRLQFGELHAAQLRIEKRGPGDDKPLQPLEQLALPLDIDLPWRIDELQWAGPPPQSVTGIAGHYRYANQHHDLVLSSADFAGGHYSARATLQGPAPMQLQARIDARIRAPLAQDREMAVTAHAGIEGPLAGAAARLRIEAELAPAEAATAEPTSEPMWASLKATLAPWAPQPVIAADATLQRIDLGRLWPQAPLTRLSGNIHAGPDDTAGPGHWQGRIALDNAKPGPWDKGRLPLERIEGALAFDGTQWTLVSANIEAGGGQIEAHGHWRPAPQPWEAQAKVRKMRPGDLHTRLAGAAVSGTLDAWQQDDGLRFNLDLQADQTGGGGKLPPGLRLRALNARGQWHAQVLDLRSLRVEAERARLEGTLQARIADQAGSGKLDLSLPGATAKMEGRIAPTQGQATLAARIEDASALQDWLQALPGAPNVALRMQGRAQLDAQWQGGWQTAQRLLSEADASLPRGGALPRLKATLVVPAFELRGLALAGTAANGTPQPLALRDLRAELAGDLAQTTLALRGEATAGERALTLDTRASGGLRRPHEWAAAIASLQAQLRLGPADSQRWVFDLKEGVQATVRTGAQALQIDGSGGALAVRGPAPGEVRIDWQPLRFGRTLVNAQPALRLQSTGRFQGLPMAWWSALAPSGAKPVHGDLIFDGDWSLDMGDTLRAQARVARRSGDLHVDVGEAALVTRVHSTGTGTPAETTIETQGTQTGTPAGLRQAELRLTAQNNTLHAALDWDSQRAGTLQAEASTPLVRGAEGWQWPESAALAGRVKARMPDLGVWSMLAPPGWRIAGTLDADVVLSGERRAPRWRGTLAADKLALRAAVQGLDLRDGRLRATLDGDRLVVDDFTLHGGTGATVRIPGRSGNLSTAANEAASGGGTLTLRGELRWPDAAAGASGAISAALQGELHKLRVLARTDRNLTLSGTLHAGLERGQITVRGQLQADRAAIILPDESAPGLGSDVMVRSAAKDRAALEAAQPINTRPAPPSTTRLPPDIVITFDLGKDFAVQGRGITTRLEGLLEARAVGLGTLPRLTGEVRTVLGQYRAYGQQLDVESGVVRFSGSLDNPAFDILAIRPNIEHRAGVQITGTAHTPRVKLFSEPALSDAETLSWVMLGRAAAASGGEAVLMQQAALALLGKLGAGATGGSLASRFGLDEIGFRGPSANGELTSAAITLGKRLSRDFYVTYERSLAGTLGTLFIFYDLSRRLTLRGQAGERSGVDLIYTLKFD